MTASSSHFITGGGGVRLCVETTGPAGGAPIVFVHGWLQSRFVWDEQWAGPLAQRSPLVRFDLRGHGQSDVPLEDTAYQDGDLWANDLAAVIADTGTSRVVVVAWSYGALLVCDYVRRFGTARIAGIVFVGGLTIKGEVRDEPFAGPALIEHLAAIGSNDAGAANRAAVAFARASTATPLDESSLHAILGAGVVVPPNVRAAMQRRRLDNHAVIAGLDVPVLVIHGREDRVVNFASGAYLAATAPHATLLAYDGVGHVPFREDAARFDRDVAAFMIALDRDQTN